MSIWTKIKSIFIKPKPPPLRTAKETLEATGYVSISKVEQERQPLMTTAGGGIKVTTPTTRVSGGRYRPPTTTAVREPSAKFTGKVEEITPTGEVRETTFVYGGERVGRYTRGADYFVPEIKKGKDVTLEFEKAGIKEKVKISPQEMFWGYEEMPTPKITPLGISDKPRGIIPFVGGVVETIKTAPTYQEGFIGIKEEFKQAFPRTAEKAKEFKTEAGETLKWLGPEQIKWVVKKLYQAIN